ncbi:hypothetical protein R69619_00405 [Paraburkholderia nemoris]|uniref:hypothetical protein n=1 Tax=Paraburkholderia nemoris TaxID=2793076 RepID=UPI00190CD0FF|nr:hypothetical protein [Paraburkholderia nemoris]MBK3737669.1 hypothetical protein [Paraburkholderia aspalathi]CAE6694371.1 hypothetical protein R69619_00405 [Paraburkholderia nemoris]
MTLCVAWRCNRTVHFASDSRLTLGQNSYADVGIKVSTLPLTILDPVQERTNVPRTVALNTDLGMCFAGSAVNSLMIKESIVEVLKSLQHAPGYTDSSMVGVANFVFKAYRMISKEVCKSALGANGRASLIIGGHCAETNTLRVFQLSTDAWNNHNMTEILTNKNHIFLGSGAAAAESNLPQRPTDLDYLNVLKSVIEDEAVPSVGGHIQYGCFEAGRFVVNGIVEFDEGVHYWRGALDLNSDEFMSGNESFVPGFTYIDPFRTFGGV